ncbi:hypothetical protein BaRGS_00004078, partial [Batillaria attramentaria]
ISPPFWLAPVTIRTEPLPRDLALPGAARAVPELCAWGAWFLLPVLIKARHVQHAPPQTRCHTATSTNSDQGEVFILADPNASTLCQTTDIEPTGRPAMHIPVGAKFAWKTGLMRKDISLHIAPDQEVYLAFNSGDNAPASP